MAASFFYFCLFTFGRNPEVKKENKEKICPSCQISKFYIIEPNLGLGTLPLSVKPIGRNLLTPGRDQS